MEPLRGMLTSIYSDRTLLSGFCGRYIPDGLPVSVSEIGLSPSLPPAEIELLEETVAHAVANSLSSEGSLEEVLVAHVSNTGQVEGSIKRVWHKTCLF